MLKKIILATITLLLLQLSKAQFYYKDILRNKQLLTQMQQYKLRKIKEIKLTSFEDDGNVSTGFFCEKKISSKYTIVETNTKSDISGATSSTSTFNQGGYLISTLDSSDIASTTTNYNYNSNNLIQQITFMIRSWDDDFNSQLKEEHIYEYNSTMVVKKMTQVKNGIDSVIYLFSTDESNNITVEKNTKTGSLYYYYYDEKNRLTDIVRYNNLSQKLLPDYIFDYDDNDHLIKMTITEQGSSNYFIWEYDYNNGMIASEKCFDKEKKLVGSIAYHYN